MQALMSFLLIQGLERLAEYDYVAIFDADFKPDTDFLVSDKACMQIQSDMFTDLSGTRWRCMCLPCLLLWQRTQAGYLLTVYCSCDSHQAVPFSADADCSVPDRQP